MKRTPLPAPAEFALLVGALIISGTLSILVVDQVIESDGEFLIGAFLYGTWALPLVALLFGRFLPRMPVLIAPIVLGLPWFTGFLANTVLESDPSAMRLLLAILKTIPMMVIVAGLAYLGRRRSPSQGADI